MTSYKRLIALDFDGVLHSYTSPWTDAATISDPPTPGAMAFLRALVEDDRFEVVIVSSRLKDPGGLTAVQDWLWVELVTEFGATEANRIHLALQFSTTRPPAFLTIDDRAMTFDGAWPDLDTLAAFRPWNKRPTGTPEGRAEIDALIAKTAAARSASRPAPAVDLDLLREVARRAYAAGCGAIEYYEADCQEEVGAILDDVLVRMKVAAEYDSQAVRIASEGIPRRTYPPAEMVPDDEGGRG
ncbi:hypothetical protein [Aureimonas sp. AU40]|uniref:hypothetical protein n=1 Tax=Aureimonas sp. AU40 TaxID=1637747 RepID=UPI0007850A56|nr:hypothetical protein [Aureimonas sp. AU40]